MNIMEIVSVLLIGIFVGLIIGLNINAIFDSNTQLFENPYDAGKYPKLDIPAKVIKLNSEPEKVIEKTNKESKEEKEKQIKSERAKLEPPKIEESKFVKSNLKKIQ